MLNVHALNNAHTHIHVYVEKVQVHEVVITMCLIHCLDDTVGP